MNINVYVESHESWETFVESKACVCGGCSGVCKWSNRISSLWSDQSPDGAVCWKLFKAFSITPVADAYECPHLRCILTWNRLWLYPCSERNKQAVWLSPLCMYVTSPWQIAVGMAVVKMKNHASNVALWERRGERKGKSFSLYCLRHSRFHFTYIKALRSVLIDILEMGCTTARNRSSDIRTSVYTLAKHVTTIMYWTVLHIESPNGLKWRIEISE